jgi:anti-sigma B factor antagonist
MAISTFCCPQAGDLTLETRSEGGDGQARVLLQGELDLAAAPLLEQEWQRIEERGKRVVVLDLAGLTFIDASGFRAVLSVMARARDDGPGLSLVGAGRGVRRLFDLAGCSDLLDNRA